MPPVRLASLLAVLVLLSGCAQERIVATAEPLCAAVAHVCISRADVLSEGTAQQIEANNLGRGKVCPPPKGDPCGGMRTAPVKPVKQSEPKTS